MQTSVTELDPDLAALARQADIVVFRSPVTDTRALERRLQATPLLRCVFVDMPMGRAAERDRFHRLSAATGWHHLPMIFVRGAFIGGEPELAAWLDEAGGRVGKSGA
ncbi:hypothetical protein [Acidihalobacter ferrooxydans]|uniref:Glutaredoxin domain-containing protein n=1 Tax=Acidihalobacter ferrooxydans TaxID=1765967 RepID=A0A1P8UGE4_9GAMM|nr:hypothetical protein [Acidihalobacter ferrooxydans]APZ42851.1 hypothetical protein BW247_06875 [Acidihalobacter ferrooxydans]